MSSPYYTLLEALRSHCHLPEFPDPIPSNQLVLELENGPTITIDFNEESSMVLLFTEIGTYAMEHELTVLTQIAHANFLWAATSGSTLSARPEIQTVYLAQQLPVCFLEGESFIKLVEEFASVAQQWIGILEKIPLADQEKPQNEDSKDAHESSEVMTSSISA